MSEERANHTVNIKPKSITLLPPRPDACQECAAMHRPDSAHNRDSLYYQMKFHREHGRWPTWKDAMSHCSAEMQAAWTAALLERGVKVE